MWTQSQFLLLDQLCALSGIRQQASQLHQTGAITVNGIPFSLLPGLSDSGLRIIAQLGEPPEEHRAKIHQRLLELNLFIDSGNHEQLAIERSTGIALFSYQFAGADAAQLIASLQRAAIQAHEWRSSYFMDVDEGVPVL